MVDGAEVSIPLNDQKETDEAFDKFLAELRVNQFDLKDLFSSSTDNLNISFSSDSLSNGLTFRSV